MVSQLMTWKYCVKIDRGTYARCTSTDEKCIMKIMRKWNPSGGSFVSSNNLRQYWQSNTILCLCLWLCASLICIDNCPMRCNTKQSIYYSASSLYMFRVSTTLIISTQNCNYSLQHCAATSLQCGQVSLAMLEAGSYTKNMTSSRGCSYSFVYSWWWVWLTPKTCRTNLQNNK